MTMKSIYKKRIQTLTALLLAAVLVVTGCGKKDEDKNDNNGLALGAVEGAVIEEDGLIDFSAIPEEKLTEIYKKEAASNQTITVNYTGSLCPVALPVAKYLGFLEEEGLTKVEFVQTSGDAARDALASGNDGLVVLAPVEGNQPPVKPEPSSCRGISLRREVGQGRRQQFRVDGIGAGLIQPNHRVQRVIRPPPRGFATAAADDRKKQQGQDGDPGFHRVLF